MIDIKLAAVLIMALVLIVPVIAIWTDYRIKVARMKIERERQTSDGETSGLRTEVVELRDRINQLAMAVDSQTRMLQRLGPASVQPSTQALQERVEE